MFAKPWSRDGRSLFDAPRIRRQDRSRRLTTEALEDRRLLTLIVGPNVDISQSPFYEAEPTIAVDPTNPLNLFVASNVQGNPGNLGIGVGYSTDGGATWTRHVIADGTDGFPTACCDPSSTWDRFGNLFFSYFNDAHTAAIVLRSTDGGKNFTLAGSIAADDQPTVTTGPGSTPGSGSVWVTFNQNGGIAVAGALVTGLGNNGAFGATQVVPGSSGNFGDIAIGPSGQVMAVWEDPSGGIGPATLRYSVDADGLGPGSFSAPADVTSTNVGGFDPIPAQAARTTDAEAGLAWDRTGGPHNGRVYFVYTNAPAVGSANSDTFLRYSDNNGGTWTAPLKVNDDATQNSQYFPRIALDQTTGNIAITFYDARNDSGNGGAGDTNHIPNDDVQFWGTVSVDGGLSVQPNVQISAGTSNAESVANPNDFGDYSALAFESGVFHPAWADNSTALVGNPGRPQPDVATAAVRVITGVGLSITDVARDEGQAGLTDFVFTVTASGTATLPATVEYASVDGTAIAPDDYGAKSGTLTFLPGGSQTQMITIQVVGDTVVEPDETFFVKLSNAQNGNITRATGVGTILNDDLNLAVNDITVVEGDSGTSDAVFTVSAEGISHLTAIVNFSTADGTANSGSDYLSRGGVLIFPPGTTSRTVTVPIVGDLLNEGTETFVVNLTNAVSAQITKAIGVGTILDNDLLPALYVNDVHVTTTQAGVLAAVFTVALDAPSGRDVSVQFATADGSAQAGLNYTAESGVVDFAPGATTKLVTVPVTSMATYAPNEKFYLNLSNPLHAALADPQGVGTIIFAEPPPNEYIMDDGDPGYSQTAGWTNLTNTLAYQLDYNYHAAGSGTGAAKWTFSDILSGSYQVFAHWIPFSNWATNAPFTVLDGANALGTVLVNQQQAPTGDQSNGITWQSLGTFQTNSGTLAVRLDDNANGFVIADAIRIVSDGIAPQIPEMDVAGFDRSIADGATTPSFDDGTDFGGIASTTSSATHTFTITNNGNADLHLTGSPAVEITGVNPQDFAVISQPATTISAGASTTFQVMFHPATTGPRQAIVSIANDDGNEQPYTFELQGTGLAAGPSQLTIDDTMPGFRAIGNWATNANSLAYSGQFHSAAAGQGADQSIWTFSGLAPGQYQVLATWVPFGNRATNAPFTAADGTVSQHAVTVNQQQAPSDVSANGVMWSSLFSINVTTGTLTVSLGNQANGFVVADAVRIVNTDPPPAVPPPAVPIVAAHNLAMPLDVNGDKHVSSLDALIVINKLNAQSVAKASAPGAMPLAALATSGTGASPNYFVDVNGDGAVSPLDALVVINYLLHAPSQTNSAAAVPQASSAASPPAAMTSAAVDQAIGQFVATQPPDAGLPANLTSAFSASSTASTPPPTTTTNLLTPLAVRAYFASSAKKSASGSGSELDTLFGS